MVLIIYLSQRANRRRAAVGMVRPTFLLATTECHTRENRDPHHARIVRCNSGFPGYHHCKHLGTRERGPTHLDRNPCWGGGCLFLDTIRNGFGRDTGV
jgi:hypothetical protein